MPQVDHRVSEGLECIVDRAQTLEAKQQAPELVLPGEDPLDGPEAVEGFGHEVVTDAETGQRAFNALDDR